MSYKAAPEVPGEDLRLADLKERLGSLEASQSSARRRLTPRNLALLAGLGMAGLFGGWKLFDHSGDYKVYQPTKAQFELIDNELAVGTWNAHNEAAKRRFQIRNLMERNNLDALAIQEVNAGDAKVLSQTLKGWYVTFGLGDAKQHPLEGGYGDVTITRQKPKNIQTRIIRGTGPLTSTINTVSNVSNDGIQEDREATALTIKVLTNEGYRDVRIINSHIAGWNPIYKLDIHNRQFRELADFARSQIKENRPTVLMGDFNADNEEALRVVGDAGFQLPFNAASTSTGKFQVIDHIAYYPGGLLGYTHPEVLDQYKTDHYAKITRWTLPLGGIIDTPRT